MQEVITAWQEGITRLIERGVTGKILLSNFASPKGLPVSGPALRKHDHRTRANIETSAQLD